MHEEPQHGALPVCRRRRRLVVQQRRVSLTAPHEALLVLGVGDDGADGQVALLQAAQHEPWDGQVDGGLDVRGLEELV